MVVVTTTTRGPAVATQVTRVVRKESPGAVPTPREILSARAGVGGTRGRTIVTSARLPPSGPSPAELARRARTLTIERGNIQSSVSNLESRTAALNRAQRAVNLGTRVDSATLTALGINAGQLNQVTVNRLKRENINRRGTINTRITSFNRKTGTAQVDVQVLGKIEMQEIERRRARGIIQAARGAPGIVAAPAPRAVTTAAGAIPRGNIFTDFGRIIFGERGTGVPLVTARGGIGERGGRTIVTTARGFAQAGERAGGVPGRAAGSLIGAGVGLGLGVLEAGPGTVGRVAEAAFQRTARGVGLPQRQAAEVGGVARLGAELFTGPGAVIRGGRIVATGARAAARQVPGTLRRVGLSRAAGISDEAAIGFRNALRGVPTGRAFTVSERVGRVAGTGVRGVRTQLTRTRFNVPLTIGAAVAAPQVAGAVVTRAERPRDIAAIQTPRGQAALTGGFQEISRIQSERGVISSLGGEVVVGAF